MARKQPEIVKALQSIRPKCARCEDNAICRVNTADGWCDFCEPHYVAYFTEQAHASMGTKQPA